uniref:Uncharacterized protein n=1 Tax=Anguilla anguilla TaxID=7936 RepID=A0A0E9SRL7_ANGAN
MCYAYRREQAYLPIAVQTSMEVLGGASASWPAVSHKFTVTAIV